MRRNYFAILIAAATCLNLPISTLAQTNLLFFQGFEGTDNWAQVNGSQFNSSTVGFLADSPPLARIRTGTSSWQVINSNTGGRTTDLAQVSLGITSGRQVEVHLASISATTNNNGADAADAVTIFVALDGAAFSTTPDIQINGTANNARWGFDATLIVTTVVGSPVSNSAPQGQAATNVVANPTNYATARIKLPLSATSVAVRVRANNNAAAELWAIDDISLVSGAFVDGPPTNQPPVIQAIGNKTVTNLDSLVFTVIAKDETDNNEITLSCSNLPVGAVFNTVTNFSGATNDFVWNPATPVGVYTARFEALDINGTTTQKVTITVVNPPQLATNYSPLWINEISYDPAGADASGLEFVEVLGLTNVDLSTYRIVTYNGADGQVDFTTNLAGQVFTAVQCDYGVASVLTPSIQNGSPDGLALVQVVGGVTSVIQALAYEGSFLGVNGPAANYLFTDIGKTQIDINLSVQLIGTGTNYSEFTWFTNAFSQGLFNAGQSITGCSVTNTPPLLAAIGSKSVTDLGTLTFSVTASDNTDHDDITLFATGSAFGAGATFPTVTNNTGATNAFNWVGATPAGVYSATFFAGDKDGTNSETISITVNPQASGATSPVWINEINYDSAVVSDADEFAEVVGKAGTDLSSWYVILYNGAGGAIIANSSNSLFGLVLTNELCGYGAVSVFYNNTMQNGAPDGLALVQGSTVRQFLSYEGTFVASGGPAAGYASIDIGVIQNGFSNTAQLAGSGTNYSDFAWVITNASLNLLNVNQTIFPCGGGGGDTDFDGLPDAWELLYFGDATGAEANVDGPDGDGIINIFEYLEDSSPIASNAPLAITNLTINSPLTLWFPSTNTRNYTVEYNDILTNGAGWSSLVGPAPGSNGAFTATDTNEAPVRDYRIKVQLP